MAKKTTIRLATNWNGKTQCDYFTHIRRSPLNAKEGEVIDVHISDVNVTVEARIHKVYKTRLSKITDFIAYIEIGQSREHFVEYIQKAHAGDLRGGYIYLYLLHRTDRELPFLGVSHDKI